MCRAFLPWKQLAGFWADDDTIMMALLVDADRQQFTHY